MEAALQWNQSDKAFVCHNLLQPCLLKRTREMKMQKPRRLLTAFQGIAYLQLRIETHVVHQVPLTLS